MANYKFGQAPPPPPSYLSGAAPAPSAVPTPGGYRSNYGTGHTAPVVKGNAAVRHMQSTMQDLAQAVMRDAISSTMSQRPGDTSLTIGTEGQMSGKKAFNDFISEQYAGTLDEEHRGVEYDSDPNTQSHTDKKKTQTGLYEIDAVMNTLYRLGTPGTGGKEFTADGIWNFRTENALRNIAGFAHALLSLQGDFGLQNQIYNERELEDFYKNLAGTDADGNTNKLDANEQTRRANDLTQHLKKITRLYDNFRRQILSRPAIRHLIEGKKAFDRYSPAGTNKNNLTAQDSQMIQSNPSITGIKFKGYQNGKAFAVESIPLSALSNKDAFINFLKTVGYTNNPDATNIDRSIKPIIDLIKKQLNEQAINQK